MTGTPTKTLLLVGNLPDLSAALDGLPCAFTVAGSVQSAVQQVESARPDLILCDYPDLDELRAAHPDAPIVVLAHDRANESVFVAMEKAFAYLTPPFEPGVIREVVVEALENSDPPGSIQVLSRQPNFIMLRLRCTFTTANRLVRFAMQLKTDLPEE
ncbi:MAG: response regulator [Bryobacteraceae bacterium]|nr:response regulator [Bryobacteraceae bacterium]